MKQLNLPPYQLAEIRVVLKAHDEQRQETARKIAAQRQAKKDERAEQARLAEERFAADQAAEDRRGENWEKREERLEHKAVLHCCGSMKAASSHG